MAHSEYLKVLHIKLKQIDSWTANPATLLMLDRPSNRHSVDGLGEASTDCREPIVAGVSRDKGSVCTSNSSIWFLCVRGW